MKATELRIGNYVEIQGVDYDEDYLCVIRALRMNFAEIECNEESDSFEYNELVGLRIIKSCLFKFGFKKLNHKMSNCHVFTKGYWRLATKDFINYSLWHEMVSPPTWNLAELQYIHQLQNIWFDLTGEELTAREQNK